MNCKTFSPQKSLSLLIILLIIASLKSNAQQPVAAIDGYASGSKISKSIFGTLPNIGVLVKAPVFEIKYQVVGYTLRLVDDEGTVRDVACKGSAFSEDAKKAIKAYARPNDIITIQNIKAIGENGVEVKIPALLYIIE